MLWALVLMVFPAFVVSAAAAGTTLNNSDNRVRTAPPNIPVLRRNIREILKDPRFNYPDRWKGLQRFWQNIRNWLAKLDSSKRSGEQMPWNKALRWIGLAALAVLPLVLIYLLPKLFARSGRVKSLSPKTAVPVVRSEDLKVQARIMADKGQFREAIRLLYLAGLEDLKTNGILPDGVRLTDKTNLNIVNRTFGSDHPCSQAFRELMLVFEEKWYGLRSCQTEDYDRLTGYLKILEANTGKPHV